MWVDMIMMFLFLLALRFGSCTEVSKLLVETVTAGENVTLSCPHSTSPLYQETFYWIRLVSGNWPEFLGAISHFMHNVSKINHIHTKKEQREFILHIIKAEQNDTGLYYCIKVKQLDFIFINGIFLKIKQPEADITDLIQTFPSGLVHPKNPETLRCLVLSDSDRKACPGDNRVFWFRAGSNNSHPSFLYPQGPSEDECERIPEVPTKKKCSYNFPKIFDAGTYYCAVAACGQILFGKSTKVKGAISQDLFNIFLPPLCAALAISVVVISWLIYKMKKKNIGCFHGIEAITGENQSQQKEEKILVYSAPTFNRRKAKTGERSVKPTLDETVYTDVRTFQ